MNAGVPNMTILTRPWRLCLSCMMFCLVAVFGWLGLLGFSPSLLKAEEPGGPHLNVVELFTSQGCSSCPPADLVLKDYTKREDVIALSYSVDYWDYLGWRDTFGKPAYSQRQRAYAQTRGDGQVYTPQVVVNGVAHVNGAHKAEIEKEMKKSEARLTPQFISLDAGWKGADVELKFEGAEQPGGAALTLWMLRVKDQSTVEIKRGENGGRELSYHNIVLSAEKAAEITSLQPRLVVKGPAKKLGKDEGLVFLLQIGATGPIVGAAQLR